METAKIAKVAVNAAPYSIDKPYDYLIPESLEDVACPGVRVTVPFGRGNRASEGVILALGQREKEPGLKALTAVLDREPVLDQADIALALWMRQRYFCTMFEAVKAILPAGLWYRLQEMYRVSPAGKDETLHLPEEENALLAILRERNDAISLQELQLEVGDGAEGALYRLLKCGLVEQVTTAKRKIHDATCKMVSLAVDAEDAIAITEAKRRTSPHRCEVVRLLAATPELPMADVSYFTGASTQTLRAMERVGLLHISEIEALRIPIVENSEPGPEIVLNEEQSAAFQQILSKCREDQPEAVLLQGVTGSGKTQIYLRLVQEVLAMGKSAMILVPEIALTPQMMRKFSLYFGENVVMLHSSLRMTERYDQWKRIRRGEVRVVLGTRSAIFAPLRNLGLIVIDEEQESSYQSENAPRYHTRDIAKYLCGRDCASLLLGSATPSIESAWEAHEGRYHHVLLRRRYNEKSLPHVIISDMRQEIRRGNSRIIGADLQAELEKNIQNGEQSILFLNRRGNSRMLLCGECGTVPECPRCSVALTYHSANGRLMCHYCGHSEPMRESCPDCGGIMKHIGTGTQRVEEELLELFPDTPVLRMDADTTGSGHEAILHRFENEKIPILLGTQMVAKGLDFENVTLVGVLSADLSLYVDHFRAAERTFNLLTQVVGRAGRGEKQGRAVIQTYTPDNEVIRYAAEQNYDRFYESEIRLRKLRQSPPFADLFTFTVSGTEEGRVLRAASRLVQQLRGMLPGDVEVLGPAPAPILKLNQRYRYRVSLIGKNDKQTREQISVLLKSCAMENTNRGLNFFVDCNTME